MTHSLTNRPTACLGVSLIMLLHAPNIAQAAADLTLTARTVSGDQIQLLPTNSGERQLTVVCFLGAECPMARIYGPRLGRLAEEFQSRGLRVIGINSNRQDSFADVKRYVDELKITFPFIHDRGNVIADQFTATRTPEVFLLDEDLQVIYEGRIDDQYEPGVNRSAPKRRDLRSAIEEALAGNNVSVPHTEALGCLIGRKQSHNRTQPVENDITYTRHVAPVLQQHCIECHRSGEIGPFAMDSFGEVAGWAETMLETIDNGRMPPWHADSQHGDFANAREMPEADKQIIRDWIAGGLKQGDAADLPPTIEYTESWQLDREPDQIVEMRSRPFLVPADGVVEYQYFVADPGFTEDKWITGAQVVPGSRAVVHHAIVFIRPPDGSGFRGVGWLGAYVPGQRNIRFPDGGARKVPAGSKLVFQMHYTPNGQPQEDITKVGLMFGNDSDVTHEIITLIGINQEFEIPPGAKSHTVKAHVPWLPEHGQLLAATPHMHYRGTSFRVFSGEGDSDTLLNVPNYDFNWQHTYAFKEPIPLKNLQQLRFEATFDNSKDNPFNPNPKEWVTWGDQTWEEMAVAFFEVAEPRRRPKSANAIPATRTAEQEKLRQKKIDDYVDRAFQKMDLNGDGRILFSEAPIVVRRFSHFHQFDRNADEVATRDEIRQFAEELF